MTIEQLQDSAYYCDYCDQRDTGQTGEYPCEQCGLPTVIQNDEGERAMAENWFTRQLAIAAERGRTLPDWARREAGLPALNHVNNSVDVVATAETKIPWTATEYKSYPEDIRKGFDAISTCRKCEGKFRGHALREVCRECATPAEGKDAS